MKTPREQLEEFLDASPFALQLLILRSTNSGTTKQYPYTEHGASRSRFEELIQDATNYKHMDYIHVLKKWGYSPQSDWFPLLPHELKVVQHYPTVEALIEAALSLGFIDQAVRCARAWEEAKK